MSTEVLVVGVGMTEFSGHHVDRSIDDLVFEAARTALRDAGAEISAITAIVAAYESDHFIGRMSAGVAWNHLIGAVGLPVVRVEGGGATGALAIQAAHARIAAGVSEAVLVVGGETNGKAVNTETAQRILGLSADTTWETPIVGTFAALYALSITAHMRLYGTRSEHFAHIAVKNRRNAANNPLAHRGMHITVEDVLASRPVADPYRLLDCSLLSDGAAAVLLATPDWARSHSRTAKDRPPVTLAGTGSASDAPRIADRNPEGLAHFAAKRAAAAVAYRMGGIDDPRAQVDVAEIYDSFTGAELQAYGDLGFCEPNEAGSASIDGRFDLGGLIPVNTSGGLLGRGSAVGATGIAQAVEIVNQLRGEVEGARAVEDARVGLTDTHAGVASLAAVNIFRRAA